MAAMPSPALVVRNTFLEIVEVEADWKRKALSRSVSESDLHVSTEAGISIEAIVNETWQGLAAQQSAMATTTTIGVRRSCEETLVSTDVSTTAMLEDTSTNSTNAAELPYVNDSITTSTLAESCCGAGLDVSGKTTTPGVARNGMNNVASKERPKDLGGRRMKERGHSGITLTEVYAPLRQMVSLQGVSSNLMELVSRGPWLGSTHYFHEEIHRMGMASADRREYRKAGFEGRLSVLSESHLSKSGMQLYTVRFTGGEMSVADGVGYIFSARLPSTKNIQKIVSIFVNQRGRICLRVFTEVIKFYQTVKPLEIGDYIGVAIDHENCTAAFVVWPVQGGRPSVAECSLAALTERQIQDKALVNGGFTGHLACVVKYPGCMVRLES